MDLCYAPCPIEKRFVKQKNYTFVPAISLQPHTECKFIAGKLLIVLHNKVVMKNILTKFDINLRENKRKIA
jgi:hypothetical protein